MPPATVSAEASHIAPQNGMTLRYFRPAADLFPAITGYHVYGRDERATGDERVDWFLPGTANIRILLDAGRVTVTIGKAAFDLPPTSLFGPTTQAMRATTHGGYIVGIGISALGWSRLDFGAASDICDRIVPLDTLAAGSLVAALQGAVATSDLAGGMVVAIETVMRWAIKPPGEDAGQIAAVMALSVANDHADVGRAAATLGVSEHTLRRLTMRYFGMMPKLLLRRARFLRSYLAAIDAGGTLDYKRIDNGYANVPHFLRDAERFLGMTARRFQAIDTPFLDVSLRERLAVLGQATQALTDISAGRGGG